MIKTIQFKTDSFLPYLVMANSIIPQKNTMSILANVRMEAVKRENDPFIALTASDTFSWLQVKIPVIDVSEHFVFCIDGRKILAALKNLGKMTACLQLNEESHEATCLYENGKFCIPFIGSEDFPMSPKYSDDVREKDIPTESLLSSLQRIRVDMKENSLVPAASGARIDFLADGMTCVTMDFTKLVRNKDFTITHNGLNPENCGFSLPKKPWITLLNVLESVVGDTVKVKFDDNKVSFSDGASFSLTTCLHTGKYPAYERQIPPTFSREAVADTKNLIDAVKRVMPMGDVSSEAMQASFSDGKVELFTENLDFSTKASETVPCEYRGEPLKIAFNGNGLLSLLQNMGDEKTRILMDANNKPIILKGNTDDERSEYMSLLMPIVMQNT